MLDQTAESNGLLKNDNFYRIMLIHRFFLRNRERLIHLLALRPFKKPELYDRLNKGKS